jgi:hypothetical protein
MHPNISAANETLCTWRNKICQQDAALPQIYLPLLVFKSISYNFGVVFGWQMKVA